ncbi:MAG TPA: transporter substrate-binding domain-containing protein [Actinomycetota bacterium]|nr:transporter substrate-binding domain-containing protein [Actinomycetota bacterium]
MTPRWKTSLAISVLTALVLAACGGGGTTTDPGAGGDPAEEQPAFEVLNEGRLTVGSDIPYPPFEFEKDGVLTGYDVEIVREIASRLGLENTDDDWISTDFGTIFQQLKSGTKFDIVVAAVTGYAAPGSAAEETVAERTKLIDFTAPYYPSLQSLMVPKGSDIKSTDDLTDGVRVAVQNATTGAFHAEKEYGAQGAEIVGFEKAPTMFQSLQGGNVDAIVNDLPVSLDAMKQFPDLEVIEQIPTGEEYAIAVSKDNAELKDAVNDALAEMFEDGTFATIYKKYFPEQELPEYASE